MKENEAVAIEIVTLQDLGYMLADSQADLTLKQKMFLNIAVPLVRKLQEQNNNNTNNSASNSLKNRIREKRRMQNGG